MKKLITAILLVAGLASAAYTIEATESSGSSPEPVANFYSQLIGFQFGGELSMMTFQSGYSAGVFFENVIVNWFGLEIAMNQKMIPITNYNYNVNGTVTAYTGNGERRYIEMSGGVKFYIQNVSIGVGLQYNNFLSGYLVNTSNYYLAMPNNEPSFFALYFGPELTAQISTDLFAKVGLKFTTGLVTESPFYYLGGRFYIAFGYGM